MYVTDHQRSWIRGLGWCLGITKASNHMSWGLRPNSRTFRLLTMCISLTIKGAEPRLMFENCKSKVHHIAKYIICPEDWGQILKVFTCWQCACHWPSKELTLGSGLMLLEQSHHMSKGLRPNSRSFCLLTMCMCVASLCHLFLATSSFCTRLSNASCRKKKKKKGKNSWFCVTYKLSLLHMFNSFYNDAKIMQIGNSVNEIWQINWLSITGTVRLVVKCKPFQFSK